MKHLHRGLKYFIVIAVIVLTAMFGTTALAAQDTGYNFVIREDEQVSAIQMHTLPARTKYNIGEQLDLTGAKLTVTFEGGKTSTVNITESMVSGFDSSVAGVCTLTVTYSGFTATFDVKITELPIVASPVFSPESGTNYSAALEITISCATEGAAIYYTTDGADPTAASTLYAGAFKLDAPATVKAVAIADGFEDSETVSAEYAAKSDENDESNGGGGGNGHSFTPYITPPPALNGEPSTWEQIAIAIRNLPHGSAITIQLNGNYTVPSYVISAIADVDARVTFVIDDMRSWYLDGALVEQPCDANLGATKIASLRTGKLLGKEGIQLRTYGVDVPAVLTVDFGTESAAIYANIYRKNDDGRLEFAGICKTDANGKAVLPTLSEQGDYVVMLFDFSTLDGDVNNDGVMNALDASAILRDIALIEPSSNPAMRDHDGNGLITEADAHAILIDIVYGRYIA